MVKISDLNKREREIKKSLNSLEKQFKNNKITQIDYNKTKKEREKELKRIELERKSVIAKLPPIPPPPKPSKTMAPVTASVDLKQIRVELKKHEKDMLFTQSEVSKLFGEVIKNRERLKGIEDSVKKLSSVKAEATKVDTKEIDERVSAQLDRMEAAMRDNVTKSRGELDRIAGDISSLKREIEDLKKLSSVFKTMDISGLRRDIESVKTKSKWLEQQVENLDIEPLYEMIKEIENRVLSSRTTGPVIIE